MVVNSITLTGMVLTAMPVGEFDKRLVILTRERGKITAFAKGARKQNSALLACTQPFTFGEFSLYEGKTSYNVLSADISNYFVELREEFESVYYGLYFCEFAEYLTRENVNETSILKLLYQSLRALVKKTIPYDLIRYIFELKIITLSGEGPQVFECVKCKKTDDLVYFTSRTGGIVCRNCANIPTDKIPVSGSTIYTMQYIISSTIEKLYTFHVTPEVLEQLKKCMTRYRNEYVDKHFKTLEMLDLSKIPFKK